MISQCVILVGGLGTRLGELTRETPKPLLPVGGKPFLDHLIHNAARFGFTDVILLAGYLGHQLLERYSGRHRIAGRDVQIRVAVESEPAGTGGALSYLVGMADDHFILMNGDSWIDLDLRAFAETSTFEEVSVKIALRRLESAGRYGSVIMDKGRIVNFDANGSETSESFINAGVYRASRSLLSEVNERPCSLERDIFTRMAREGKLSGEVSNGFFIDIGTTDDYSRSGQDLINNLRRPAVIFDRDGVLNVDQGYTHRLEDLRWNEGAIAAVKAVNEAGWYAFVATNQAGIARGLYEEADVEAFHNRMDQDLAIYGAHIDEYTYCPFHPDAQLTKYRVDSLHRKPGPGMIKDLLEQWPVDAARSFLIGDKESDLKAATAASINSYLFSGGDLRQLVMQGLNRFQE